MRLIKMTMEDSKPEIPVEKKQKSKKKPKNTNDKDENNPQGIPKKGKKKAPKKKSKNTKEIDEITPAGDDSSDTFTFSEIANNKEASALIHDLVECFTSNSTLPQKELDVLNKTLYEKTVSVFMLILNDCVEKICNKLLGGSLLNTKKVVKKDASCQTDVSYEDS